MSGGKGGSQTTEATIPEWAKQPTIRNLARAEQVQKIGYMPYYGPDIAAFTPQQEQAMQANQDAASAFGLASPGVDAMAGMPEAQSFGGMSGYSSSPIYEAAVAELKEKQPGFVNQYDQLFGQQNRGGQVGPGYEDGRRYAGFDPGNAGMSGGSQDYSSGLTPSFSQMPDMGSFQTQQAPQMSMYQAPMQAPMQAPVPNQSMYQSPAPGTSVDDQYLQMMSGSKI